MGRIITTHSSLYKAILYISTTIMMIMITQIQVKKKRNKGLYL